MNPQQAVGRELTPLIGLCMFVKPIFAKSANNTIHNDHAVVYQKTNPMVQKENGKILTSQKYDSLGETLRGNRALISRISELGYSAFFFLRLFS